MKAQLTTTEPHEKAPDKPIESKSGLLINCGGPWTAWGSAMEILTTLAAIQEQLRFDLQRGMMKQTMIETAQIAEEVHRQEAIRQSIGNGRIMR